MTDVIQNEQEELREQEELSKKPSKEEIRVKVIDKYGLDEVEHETLIDALAEDQLAVYERTGKLISQKRNLRDELKKATETPKLGKDGVSINPEEILKKAEEVVEKRFEQRDLNDLGLPDEIKAEVQKVAKAQGISIRQAANDPYIVFKKEQWEKEQKTEEASIGRKNNTAAATAFSIDNPPKLDLSLDPNSPEGKAAVAKFQKEQAAWMEQAKKS